MKGVADEPVDSFENCVQLIESLENLTTAIAVDSLVVLQLAVVLLGPENPRYGNTMKTVAATAMNAKSSRAHTIFKLMVEKRDLVETDQAIGATGKIN